MPRSRQLGRTPPAARRRRTALRRCRRLRCRAAPAPAGRPTVARVLGRDAQLAVRDDVVVGVARVDRRLEDLHALAGDLRAAQAADELFALAAEHAADDDLDPARRRGADDVHAELYDSASRLRASDRAESASSETARLSSDVRLAIWYSPVSVLTRITSPSPMNGGTWIDHAGLERGGLDLVGGGRALDGRHGLDDLQVDRLRQLDADRLLAVELDLDGHLGLQKADRVAEQLRPAAGSARRCRCP